MSAWAPTKWRQTPLQGAGPGTAPVASTGPAAYSPRPQQPRTWRSPPPHHLQRAQSLATIPTLVPCRQAPHSRHTLVTYVPPLPAYSILLVLFLFVCVS